MTTEYTLWGTDSGWNGDWSTKITATDDDDARKQGMAYCEKYQTSARLTVFAKQNREVAHYICAAGRVTQYW
jgi:hypothetical protein